MRCINMTSVLLPPMAGRRQLRATRRDVLRRLGAGLAVALLALPRAVPAQPPAAVTLQAQWSVHLQADGKGSDDRGAQLLVLLGGLGGSEGVATAQDTLTWPADGTGVYRIDSTLTPRGALAVLLRRLHWVRTAGGEVRNGQPELLQASNRKGDGPTTWMHITGGQMVVQTGQQQASAALSPSRPAPVGLTDPLTLAWGHLQRPLPVKPFTVALLINDKVQTAHIVPQRVQLAWQGENVACTLLDAQSEQSSATLRIWLRHSDGLPLQVELGMGERYGLDVVQVLTAVPPGLDALRARQ